MATTLTDTTAPAPPAAPRRAWVPADQAIARARAAQATPRPGPTVRVLPRSRVEPAIATAIYLCRSVLAGDEPPAALETAIRVLLDAVTPPAAPSTSNGHRR